jgi:hypothetical protein
MYRAREGGSSRRGSLMPAPMLRRETRFRISGIQNTEVISCPSEAIVNKAKRTKCRKPLNRLYSFNRNNVKPRKPEVSCMENQRKNKATVLQNMIFLAGLITFLIAPASIAFDPRQMFFRPRKTLRQVFLRSWSRMYCCFLIQAVQWSSTWTKITPPGGDGSKPLESGQNTYYYLARDLIQGKIWMIIMTRRKVHLIITKIAIYSE